MISKVDGDSTPLFQRSLSVLLVVDRLWASQRLGHPKDWVRSWVPQSVFSLGSGCRQLRLGFPLLWTLRRSCPVRSDQLHVMVADDIKSFDTVDRSILDCVAWVCLLGLGRFTLPTTTRPGPGSSSRLGQRWWYPSGVSA